MADWHIRGKVLWQHAADHTIEKYKRPEGFGKQQYGRGAYVGENFKFSTFILI